MQKNKWDALTEKILHCTKCDLHKTRKNVVVGVGNQNAEVLFIGEAPGKNEDEKSEPFVGRSGKLLDEMLLMVGLSRKRNIYIGNIVKCRPPENRNPLPTEQQCCTNWLRDQTALINPKIVVCLGRIASCHIIDEKFKVTKEHGKFVKKDDIWIMGTFHPASLLRNPRQKEHVVSDFLALKDKISEVCERTVLVYDK